MRESGRPAVGRSGFSLGNAEGLRDRSAADRMTPNTILWIYIVLLAAGGVMGYVKAGSKISLLMSVAFAAALSLCAANIIAVRHLADILLAFLLVFFGLRVAKSKKFMPMGLMTVATALALALRHLV
jgi:uncharacterized membrane protein (UPF0136 family)